MRSGALSLAMISTTLLLAEGSTRASTHTSATCTALKVGSTRASHGMLPTCIQLGCFVQEDSHGSKHYVPVAIKPAMLQQTHASQALRTDARLVLASVA